MWWTTPILDFIVWLCPPEPLETVTDVPFSVLIRRYARRDRLGHWLGIASYIVLAVLYDLALLGLTHFLRQQVGDAVFWIGWGPIECAVFAAALSVGSGLFVVCEGLRLWLGKREYEIYMAYGAKRLPAPFHLGKLFRWGTAVLFLPTAIFTVLTFTSYTAFTPTAIIDSPVGHFGLARLYPYAEVGDVYLARRSRTRNPEFVALWYVVTFRDGRRWESDPRVPGSNWDLQRDGVNYLSRQTGQPIRGITYIEDIRR